MKETRTAKGGPECPTLLHYIAKVLMRNDPLLVTFLDDIPHLEAASRSKFSFIDVHSWETQSDMHPKQSLCRRWYNRSTLW
jgi:hypothetical protein